MAELNLHSKEAISVSPFIRSRKLRKINQLGSRNMKNLPPAFLQGGSQKHDIHGVMAQKSRVIHPSYPFVFRPFVGGPMAPLYNW